MCRKHPEQPVVDSTESGREEVADPLLTAPQGHGDPLAVHSESHGPTPD